MSASIKTTAFNRTIPRTQLRALSFPIASNLGNGIESSSDRIPELYRRCLPPEGSPLWASRDCRHSCNAIMGNFDQEEEPQDVH